MHLNKNRLSEKVKMKDGVGALLVVSRRVAYSLRHAIGGGGSRRTTRLSQQAFAELAFGFVPIDEGFFAFRDALFAFAENVGVPRGGLEAIGVAGQIRPDGFHGAKLFRRGHLVEWEDGVHVTGLFSGGLRARRKVGTVSGEALGCVWLSSRSIAEGE